MNDPLPIPAHNPTRVEDAEFDVNFATQHYETMKAMEADYMTKGVLEYQRFLIRLEHARTSYEQALKELQNAKEQAEKE